VRLVGLHVRLNNTIIDVARYAFALSVPIFQCFFIKQSSNQIIQPEEQEITEFLTDWRPKFQNLYLHGSYWINLASTPHENRVLVRELELARKFEFTHIIIHPGSAKKSNDKKEGISTIAKSLNHLLKHEQNVKIILENTAHAGLSIGGDLKDFYYLKERLEHPEKVLFCLDTSHAHSYGYDIISETGQTEFLAQVDATMGLSNIALIHLNDTQQLKGSRIDRHENIGNGLLTPTLQAFINRDELKTIPVVLELPVSSPEQEEKILQTVRGW
jgi:deoxyribonuclease IV